MKHVLLPCIALALAAPPAHADDWREECPGAAAWMHALRKPPSAP